MVKLILILLLMPLLLAGCSNTSERVADKEFDYKLLSDSGRARYVYEEGFEIVDGIMYLHTFYVRSDGGGWIRFDTDTITSDFTLIKIGYPTWEYVDE